MVWRRKGPADEPSSLGAREVDFDSLMASAASTAMPRRWTPRTRCTSSTPAAPPASPRAYSTSTAATWSAPTTTSRTSGTSRTTTSTGAPPTSAGLLATATSSMRPWWPGLQQSSAREPRIFRTRRVLRDHREVRRQRTIHRAHGPADADALRRGLPQAVRPALAAFPHLRGRAAEPRGPALEL